MTEKNSPGHTVEFGELKTSAFASSALQIAATCHIADVDGEASLGPLRPTTGNHTTPALSHTPGTLRPKYLCRRSTNQSRKFLTTGELLCCQPSKQDQAQR